VCRPQPRPARCRPAAHGPGGRVRVGPGRRALACVGCALSRRWRLPAVLLHAAERLRGSDPGRSGRVGPLRLLTGLGHAAPCPPGSLMELSSGRGHAAPRSPEESRRRQLAAGPRGPLRLSSGQGHVAPCPPEESSVTVVRAGARCALFAGGVIVPLAGGRAAWAVATVVRAGADAPCSPERSSHRRSAAGPRGTRDCQPGGGPGAP
jgi:hypothetical protein